MPQEIVPLCIPKRRYEMAVRTPSTFLLPVVEAREGPGEGELRAGPLGVGVEITARERVK